jgi:hypothetical protein
MKYFFILGAMAMTFVAQAQWTSDLESNTLAAESSLSIVQSLGASDGSTYVVYWKEVGALANLELRLQRLNADGTAALGPAGILVSSEINMSTCIDLIDVDATALSNGGFQTFRADQFRLFCSISTAPAKGCGSMFRPCRRDFTTFRVFPGTGRLCPA